MRTDTYLEVFRDLDAHHLRYVVQRGYADWPTMSGDLDLLIDSGETDAAVSVVSSAVQRRGWDLTVVCHHVDEPVVWATMLGRRDAIVEIDLAAEVWWAAGHIIDPERALAQRRRHGPFWVPRPGDESVIVGVPRLLGSRVAADMKGAINIARVRALVRADPDGAAAAWRFALGRHYGPRALEAIETLDMEALRKMAGSARSRRCAHNLLRRPAAAARRTAFVLWQRDLTAACGLWASRGAHLEPLRKIETDDAAWSDRLLRIAANHPASSREAP